jgi:glycosyltransferase involved in cell wall biosynthesis
LFRELARNRNISLTVVHAQTADLPNCAADGFVTDEVDDWNIPLAGNRILWHRPQWTLATRNQCDVLVLSGNLRYASLLPGLLRARRNRIATVLWGHHYGKSGGLFSESLRKNVYFRLADSILCYSHGVANSIRQCPAFAAKTFVAPNAIDQNPVNEARLYWAAHPENLETFRIRNQLGIGPHLLFVSRIKPRNHLEILLETLAKIRREFPNASATIIGAHNEEQRRIKNLAVERGLEYAVRFPGAIYDEQELAPWFLTADAFVYPSQIGLSLFHALGYGLPVIAGVHERLNNPEVEALQDGVNGFRFVDGNSDQAVDRTLQILRNPGLKIQMGRNALETVRDEFNIERMARNFLAAILFAARAKGISN